LARIAVILMACAQVAASALPALGIGTPIGEQSDEVRTLITPAGWAFSIWGALYLGALLFAIYQAWPSQRDNRLIAKLRWPAAGAFFANALWATYVQLISLNILSVAIIFFGLFSALAVYRRLADWPAPFTTGERWLAVLPLSALAAWLTAAAIVNVAASLRYHGVEIATGSVAVLAAAVLMVGGAIAGAALVSGKGNPPYALVFLWALAAIYAANGQASPAIASGVGVAAVLTLLGMIAGLRGGAWTHWINNRRR
jgi:hypothetical protein